jgi:tRNA nucleotidyltransferase (CCA-adding enzyme)
MVSQQAAKLTHSDVVRFAAQLHDVGKGLTPKDEWPSHKMHGHTGLAIIKALCERVRVPNEFKEVALAVCAQHTNIHRADELRPSTFLKIFNQLDVWRKPIKLDQVLVACEADHLGRKGFETLPYPQKKLFEKSFKAALSIDVQQIIKEGFKDKSIRDELDRRRVKAIGEALGVRFQNQDSSL